MGIYDSLFYIFGSLNALPPPAAAAPPIQTAYRPTTPQSPAATAGGASVPAPPASRNSQPTNKYGITVPSMDDFKDPRFQSGFKFAGSAMSAAGGLLNKHVLGGQNHHGQQGTPQEQAAVAAPPPKANKPTPFKVSRKGILKWRHLFFA